LIFNYSPAMKNLWTLVFLLGCSLQLFSQNITYAEYFIDNDPGVDNGTQIPVLTQSDSVVLNYTVVTPGLSEGMHTLFVRTRDDSARWSHFEGRTFYVTDMTPAANKQVVAAEYFFDNDPGAENSTPLTINNPSSTVSQTISIPVSGLSEGMHMACFRTKDNQGKWSPFEQRTFYITDNTLASAKQVVEAEYFIDTDPGAGNGNPLTFSHPSDSSRLNFTVNPVFPLGSSHHLFIRTKDSQGKWSHYEGRQFEICSDYGAHSDFRFDINSNNVLFHNLSEHDTSHQWIFGDGNSSASLYNPGHVFSTSGIYQTCLITSNVCATDTLCRPVTIRGVTSIAPASHANTGYSLNIVSGFGFTPSSTVSFSKVGQPPIVADTTIFINSQNIKANFSFNSAAIGKWDVVVTDSIDTDTLKEGFSITVLIASHPEIDIIGPSNTLIGRHTVYHVKVTNTGTATLFGVPVHIRGKGNPNLHLLNPRDNSGVNQAVIDSIPPFVHYVDSATGDPVFFGSFIIPFIPPGSSRYVHFTAQANTFNTFNIKASTTLPLFTEMDIPNIVQLKNNPFGEGSARSSCEFMPPCLDCALALGGLIPGVGCITGGFSLGCSIGNIINDAWDFSHQNYFSGDLLLDLVGNIGGTFIDCGGAAGVAEALEQTAEVVEFTGDGADILDRCIACGDPNLPLKDRLITPVAPGDPNGKYGPGGYDSNNFISGNEPLNYTIFFENVDTATAPASEVVLTDVIDTTVFDLNSFEFTGFGFGDSIYFFSEKSGSFARDIDLRPQKNIILRVSGFVNKEDGKLEARFASFDPLTMNITDSIFEGFLPPNVNPQQGQGQFSFSISPKENLAHGTLLENAAEIVFDFNAPIVTPAWVNTVDRVKPESAMNPLPTTTSDSVISLSWSGSDDDAGIMDYAIYGSVDDSAYVRLFATDDTFYSFKVDSAHIYKFYSIARDRVANTEDIPPVPDVMVSVVKLPDYISDIGEISNLSVYPNPFSQSAEVQFYLKNEQIITIELRDINGYLVQEYALGKLNSGNHALVLSSAGLKNGYYSLIILSGEVKMQKLILLR